LNISTNRIPYLRSLNISATRQTYVAVYMLRLGLWLVLGLFSALLGPAHFAMICSGHGQLCLTGCRNSAPAWLICYTFRHCRSIELIGVHYGSMNLACMIKMNEIIKKWLISYTTVPVSSTSNKCNVLVKLSSHLI